MRRLLLFATLCLANADRCSFTIDGRSYDRTVVLQTDGLPTNLASNPKTDELFYTLIDLKSLQDDEMQTKMDNYVLANGSPIKLLNLTGQTSAVDKINNKVYFGTESGLYQYDRPKVGAEYIGLKEHDIVHLYKPMHTDQMYAIFFPNHDVYVITANGSIVRKIEEIPCAYILAVDRQNNIYFECETEKVKNVNVLLNGFKAPIQYVGFPKDFGKALTVDDSNRVLFATSDGLYHLSPDNVIPKKIMTLDYVPSGLYVDGKDYYIATQNIIYKYSDAYC